MRTSHHVPPLLVRSFARIFSFCIVSQTALYAAELEYALAPEAENVQLGSLTLGIGDLNDDGITEIAVADQSYIATGNLFGSGIVYLLDGSDGSLIESFQGAQARSQNFGFSMTTLNADGDGIPDLAIGAPGTSDANGPGAGAVWIYSGADGSAISNTVGSSRSAYGSSLANAGDQDGDGLDDLFVGAPRGNGDRGEVVLQSSRNGSAIWTVGPEGARSSFGSRVIALDDLDGDGLFDFAVSAPYFRNPGLVGRVVSYRSSDHSPVAERLGTGQFNLLGDTLVSADDADGDGLRDLMVGSYNGGNCFVLSGSDLSEIADLSISPFIANKPLNVGGSFDADGDGVSDWLIGSSGLIEVDGGFFGGIRIISGTDRSEVFTLDSEVPDTGFARKLSVLPGFGLAFSETSFADPENGGRGLVQVWSFEQFDANPDSDGDGISDDRDVVVDSDMSPTVVLLGVDSGVENRVDTRGRTLADHFARYSEPRSRRHAIRYFFRINAKILWLQHKEFLSRREARTMRRSSVIGLIKHLRKR